MDLGFWIAAGGLALITLVLLVYLLGEVVLVTRGLLTDLLRREHAPSAPPPRPGDGDEGDSPKRDKRYTRESVQRLIEFFEEGE